MNSTTEQVALLYRRAGFGATPEQITAAAASGYGATVNALLAGLTASDLGADAVPTPTFAPAPTDLKAIKTDPGARQALQRTLATEHAALTDWWLGRMVATTNPLAEKLTFLLHGHFPTAISKVRFPQYMYGQNQLFRSQGPGDFDALTQAVSADPAMLIWLDADTDKKADPNENFARELMERFTMGIGSYSEDDVLAAAVCFTGWRLDRFTGKLAINPGQHDPAPQTFLGHAGVNTGTQVIDQVTHSDASAHYVPAMFWSHLAYPVATTDPVVADLAVGYASNRNMTALLRAIFEHPDFVSTASRTGLIKQPTEYVVGALRTFGVTASQVAEARIQPTLAALGQVLFDPPSVGGWAQNSYWLSTAAALARWQFAHRLAATVDLSAIADQPAVSRLDATASLLGLAGWTSATAAALRGAANDPRTLVTLALVSPEYVSN